MMIHYIDCASEAHTIKLKASNTSAGATLCVIQVGDDSASNTYIKGKMKDCEECGVICKHIKLPAKSKEQVLSDLERTSRDNEVQGASGVIIQLPLPFGIQFDDVKHLIQAAQDVDGFLSSSPYAPCTPDGIMHLLRKITNVEEKKCVVIGRSDIVGKPMARMLLDSNATVTVCHSKTPKEIMKREVASADVVVCATGIRGVLSSNDCKDGSIIIDVGIHRSEDGHLCGDVVIDDYDKELWITPVPGGVGLLTRAMLMWHTADAHRRRSATQ